MVKRSISVFLALVMLLSVSFVAQAGSVNVGPYTLFVPDSFTSCTPSSQIYTTGIEPGRPVHVWFFQHSPSSVGLGDYWSTGNVNVNFPYPTISGEMVFSARVDILNADGSILIKLEQQWHVTCDTTPPPPPSQDWGCSPGFWKTHTGVEYWGPVHTTDSYNALFDPDFTPDLTLLQVLELKGGGIIAEARLKVANYLNTTSGTFCPGE